MGVGKITQTKFSCHNTIILLVYYTQFKPVGPKKALHILRLTYPELSSITECTKIDLIYHDMLRLPGWIIICDLKIV